MSPPVDPGARPLPAPIRPGRAAAAWALTVLALSAAAWQASGARAAEVARSDSVLVRVEPSSSPAERVGVRRALGAEAVRPLVAGWRAYELPSDVTLPQARRLLAGEPAVQAVHLDARLHPLEIPDDTYFGHQWALTAIDAPAGWDASGPAAPVVVAVIDTGVQTAHPDLSARLWQNPGEIPGNGVDDDGNGYVDDVSGWNFHDRNATVYSAADGDSHGTHVAGTIAARRGDGAGIAGVADNARIMPLKFLKPAGGYTSDAIEAIQYATDHGATIINASWGGETPSPPLCDAIALAGERGVLFVAAAGNGGDDAIGDDNDAGPSWPANCSAANLVSVAATAPGDALATFSNFGAASVDLGAPGENVLSTVPHMGFGYKSGTSMAAPHVSGVAAVVLGMHPALEPWQLKAALMAGGDPAPGLAGVTVSGRRVDLVGALQAAGAGVGSDATPPDAFSALSPGDGLISSAPGAPVFTWSPSSDGQTGVAAYHLVVGGAVVATVGPAARSATPPSPLAEGAHRWSVVAVDGAGNARSTPERTLTIDRTAPSAPALLTPASAARVAGPAVDLSWAPSQDAVTGVASYRLVVDGVAVATVPGSATSARLTMTRDAHTWQVIATDGAGNQATSAARGLIVTGTIPTLRLRPAGRLALAAPRRLPTAGVSRLRMRVRSARAARVTMTVRRADRARPLGIFRIRARAGVTTVRLPRGVARRMRPRGTYVVQARISPAVRDTVRITVVPRRR